ncbi:MAG TPA: DUF3572 domain-containing protein [Xanthobacteraceae bacterium]|jgi:hypothetical protein|nr:DUF3572 domain-containing protein [Xanthobacteraceae bacterium]
MKKPSGRHRKLAAQTRAEAATEIAVAALSFLAQEPGRLAGFLAATGIGPQSLRAAAHEPGFLLGVLEYLVGDESLLLAFAAERELDPQEVAQAREALDDRPGHTGAA